MGEVVRRVDERDVGKGLREVADEPPGRDVVLLSQQAHIVAQARKPLEEAPRIVEATEEDIGIRQPESAGQEGAFTRRQAVPAGAGVVAQHEAVAQQTALDRC